MGHFEKNTWPDSEQKKEKNWNCSILGHFKNLCKCHHVQNISSTHFLGHFKYPPVFGTSISYRYIHRTLKTNSKTTCSIWVWNYSWFISENDAKMIILLSTSCHLENSSFVKSADDLEWVFKFLSWPIKSFNSSTLVGQVYGL